jgi:phospholipid/cholesterol/gamma-HCH transport system ATP-binding protein
MQIKIKDLHKSFGSHKVLQGIDLEIKSGSSMVILGGSGSGKSVLIKNIIGLMQPEKGEIWLDEIETTHISNKKRFEIMAKCGFLFQAGALFDSLTVLDNVTFFAEKLKKLTRSEKRDLAAKKLHDVGMPPRILDLYPSELSGGMQKRVALARAICTDPEVIFFDEPTTGLDPIMANVINELIIKISQELGATTVTITHDMISARQIANDVSLIYEGKIVWRGKKDDLDASKDQYLRQFVDGSTKGPIAVDL